jgi:hypothetical protein
VGELEIVSPAFYALTELKADPVTIFSPGARARTGSSATAVMTPSSVVSAATGCLVLAETTP